MTQGALATGIGRCAVAAAFVLLAGAGAFALAKAVGGAMGVAAFYPLGFGLLALCAALLAVILAAFGQRKSPSNNASALFKAVQDISLEGVVVYRAVLDRTRKVVDFEYRYANPAARAIMMN